MQCVEDQRGTRGLPASTLAHVMSKRLSVSGYAMQLDRQVEQPGPYFLCRRCNDGWENAPLGKGSEGDSVT